MDANVKQKRRWLIEFSLISLVPMLLLAYVLSDTLIGQARERAMGSARTEARIVADIAVRRAIGDGLDASQGITS